MAIIEGEIYPTYLQRDKFKYLSDSSDMTGVSASGSAQRSTSKFETSQVAFASTRKVTHNQNQAIRLLGPYLQIFFAIFGYSHTGQHFDSQS